MTKITTDESPTRDKMGNPDGRYDTTADVTNKKQEEQERIHSKNIAVNESDLDESTDYVVRED